MSAPGRARNLMIVAAFFSMVDRSVFPPLIPVIADDFQQSVATIGNSLTVYTIAYAALQLVWSTLSSRWGRIRILTISTALAGVGNVVSALASDPVTMLVSRSIAGAGFAATFTIVLVYFGDTLTMRQRAVATANLAASVALGMALGTLGAGVIAQLSSWRFVFAATAVACLALTILLVRLPEPPLVDRQRLLPSIKLLAKNGWGLSVLALTIFEGILFIGIFNYLPVSLQARGESVLVAGIATAAFGIAVIVVSQLMKLVIPHLPPFSLMLVGGASTVAAYSILSWRISPATVLIAALLLGLAWALAHTTMQTWMTDAVANARAVGMSFFSIALFAGGSIGAALGSLAASRESFPVLFVSAAISAVLFTVASTFLRARYRVQEHL